LLDQGVRLATSSARLTGATVLTIGEETMDGPAWCMAAI
jgi:hypothetical protein